MYVLNPNIDTLPTAYGVFTGGNEVDLTLLPLAVRQQWIENSVVLLEGNEILDEMSVADVLTNMNRDKLKAFITQHSIPVKIKTNQSDDVIRQMIRDLSAPEALSPPPPPPTTHT